MIDSQILAFTGLAALLTISPGADTMLVIRSVLARGRGAGIATTFGICCGLFVHATLSAAGLSLIILKSALAFDMLKLAGAGYLIFLGVQSLRQLSAHPAKADAPLQGKAEPSQKTARRAFMEGMLNNLLNPKAAVFYLAFLPQFINPGDPVLAKSLLLAGIHFVMGIVWLSLVSLFLGKLKNLIVGGSFRRWLEATSGAVLIGLGVSLALEKR
ncbi:MAG: LysE family translocator [Desulfobacterales bacterium]|nr:LysE family translocator [Desulfobacterales bacterium]